MSVSVEDEDVTPVSSATGRPLTKRGEATRRRLLEAAETVFADQGYHEASIVKITERAGIGLGTFYLYFDSKQAIFEALVIDLNRRVRHSMSEAMAGASSRLEAERAGFAGFFRFTAAHPALYRVVREAEFVSPETLRLHYTRIVEGYEAGLRAAQGSGDVDPALDPEVTAWALMGMGELIGMRFLLWERDAEGRPPAELDPAVMASMSTLIDNALAPRTGGPTSTKESR
ncbi:MULTISPECIES: TetR/AcrR family transcriptional regulator [Microbacterium]|jgi:AcrR family transcriptional regulator|uniref:TetR/AcrR family transcriptional regulator n=1 Tax=Microbacterium schleiferi TaxID=69362 RepID=A0ABU7V610_9MICO|nr:MULTISPECIES: TetR/AcrR family transcriptional regulator [unclassified Microbacterium]MBD3752103.1 TetR/AcrR family transcriptional regulator [Micrococcales bacterium]OJV94988.1 MAG: TetR family transcriptional regulator [Microbacterium sp. 67-17]